ncbi:hypothetical protein [Lysobacter sp. FW306-1B-D06B]|uniref:hypothetical protein n=1 Tax=Lysobacter sp. FW306-1B-D06B TaxID=3140250 RepID=UPI003140C88B
MTDSMPTRLQVAMGVAVVLLFAVLGTFAVRSRAADDCRAAISRATTDYKMHKALRSVQCREALGRPSTNDG